MLIMVKMKNRRAIAFVDIRNIAEPTPISLIRGGMVFVLPQQTKDKLLPS